MRRPASPVGPAGRPTRDHRLRAAASPVVVTRDLMLLSNSRRRPGDGVLVHVHDILRDWLPDRARVAFVPYALGEHDDYTATFRAAMEPMGWHGARGARGHRPDAGAGGE